MMGEDTVNDGVKAVTNTSGPRPFRRYRRILQNAIQDPNLPDFKTQDDYIFHLEKRIITLERWIEAIEALLPESTVPGLLDEADLAILVRDSLYADRPKGANSQ